MNTNANANANAARIGQAPAPLPVGTAVSCIHPRGCDIWNRDENWNWYVRGVVPFGSILFITAPWGNPPTPLVWVREGQVFAQDVRVIAQPSVTPPAPRPPIDPRTRPSTRIPSPVLNRDPRAPVSERTDTLGFPFDFPIDVVRVGQRPFTTLARRRALAASTRCRLVRTASGRYVRVCDRIGEGDPWLFR